MASATVPVHVHLGDNLPFKRHDQELSLDLDIETSGDTSWLGFRKLRVNGGTTVEMFVHDLSRLGVSPSTIEQEISVALSDLVVSLNLVSVRGVFTLEGREFATFTLSADGDEEPPTIQRDEEGNVTVTAIERVQVRDSVTTRMSTSVPLNVDEVLSVFRRLRIVRADEPQHHTLAKAIDRFESACGLLDHEQVVARYAEAASLAACIEHEVVGKTLHARVAALTGLSQDSAADVLEFYNRTKHVDNDEQKRIYRDGLKRIGFLAYQARRLATRTILATLPQA